MKKHKIRESIPGWGCLGKYGYGQGRAVAEFGESAIGDRAICQDVCPKNQECSNMHYKMMDERFPLITDIVHKTVVSAKAAGLPVVNMVVSAMNVAVKRDNVEALRIREGLKRYNVDTMTDHYIYGQFENLERGYNRESPDAKPTLVLIGAKL